MALIGRIRKRVGLLIGFVGVSMILFILGDLVTSNTGLMQRNSDVIGVIRGEKVHHQEYEKRVETITETYKTNTKNENVDANAQDMLREQAWGMFVNENTLGKEYEKLGLSCSNEELYNMCTGSNPNPQVKQAFTDPKTGVFDPSVVVRFLKDLPNREEAVQRQWRSFEDGMREERVAEKYKNLIKSGIFVTTEEAKRSYDENQRSASIRFVRLDYNTVTDTAVKFEDSDLKDYYTENKNKYKQAETTRKVEYVTFDVKPSSEDFEMVKTWINTKNSEFAQSTNDELFINQNSDTPLDSNYHAKGSFMPVLDSLMFNSPLGTMYGPYEEGTSMKIAKLLDTKIVSDSVKARHILVQIENNDTVKARLKADSLKNMVLKGSPFEFVAMASSADKGSGMKGGDLGWFRKEMMVPEFSKAAFDGKKGDMPIVVSQYGFHIIEILDKSPGTKQVKVGIVERKIEPSQKTFDAMYNKASEFASKNLTGESFDSSIVKQGLNKRLADNLRENEKNIAGLDQPRELVRWAYSAKKNDVSKVFTFGDKYVIAHLTDIREKGFLPLESVKDQVVANVRKRKKADLLIEKFNAANATSIDALAQKLNTTATDAENVTFANGYIAGIGSEQQVVGTIYSLKPNQLSKPIKGENGVTEVVVKSFNEPQPVKDLSATAKEKADALKSRSEYEVFNALKEKAEIEDNRGKFY